MEMNWKEIARDDTKRNINIEMAKIANNYMKIYDEYYDTGSRDSAFLKDLVDSIIDISAILETYTNLGNISNSYVIERLEHSMNMINSVKEYYIAREESKNE